jgi:hypothetical protein
MAEVFLPVRDPSLRPNAHSDAGHGHAVGVVGRDGRRVGFGLIFWWLSIGSSPADATPAPL